MPTPPAATHHPDWPTQAFPPLDHRSALHRVHDALRPRHDVTTLAQSRLAPVNGRLRFVAASDTAPAAPQTPPCKPDPAPDASPPPSRQKFSYRDAEKVALDGPSPTCARPQASSQLQKAITSFLVERKAVEQKRQQQNAAREANMATTCEYFPSPRLEDFLQATDNL